MTQDELNASRHNQESLDSETWAQEWSGGFNSILIVHVIHPYRIDSTARSRSNRAR